MIWTIEKQQLILGLFQHFHSIESYLKVLVNQGHQWVLCANAPLLNKLSNHTLQNQQGVKRRQPYHGFNESRPKYGVWSFALDPRIDYSDTPFSFHQSPRCCRSGPSTLMPSKKRRKKCKEFGDQLPGPRRGERYPVEFHSVHDVHGIPYNAEVQWDENHELVFAFPTTKIFCLLSCEHTHSSSLGSFIDTNMATLPDV